LFTAPVRAQELLSFPLSARVVAMGSAGAADNSTPSTIILNPANVIGAPRFYAQGTEVTVDIFTGDFWMRRANAGASLHLGPALLGFDLSYSRLHANYTFAVTTVPQTLTEDLVGLAVGAGFVSANNDFMIGAAGRRFAEDEQSVSYPTLEAETTKSDAVAFDAGFEFRKPRRAAGMGCEHRSRRRDPQHGQRLRVRGKHSQAAATAPERIERAHGESDHRRVGARVPLIALLANLDAARPRDGDWEWMAGTELAVAQILFLRSGIHTFTGSDNPDPSNATWGAGVGIPLRKLRARLDYGRESEFFGKIEHYELTLERTF
jgi:hypothetical protein